MEPYVSHLECRNLAIRFSSISVGVDTRSGIIYAVYVRYMILADKYVRYSYCCLCTECLLLYYLYLAHRMAVL